jgi:hypothetical protein
VSAPIDCIAARHTALVCRCQILAQASPTKRRATFIGSPKGCPADAYSLPGLRINAVNMGFDGSGLRQTRPAGLADRSVTPFGHQHAGYDWVRGLFEYPEELPGCSAIQLNTKMKIY